MFSWEYVARASPTTGPDAAAAARARLDAALRAVHGIAGPLLVSLSSGPSPVLRISTVSPEGRRWFEHGFEGAYGPGRWRPVVVGDVPSAGELFARRRRLPGEGTPPAEGASPLDALTVGFGSLPPGIDLRLEVTPVRRRGGLDRWVERLVDVAAPVPRPTARAPIDARPARTLPPVALSAEAPLWLARISIAYLGASPRTVRVAGRAIAEAGLERLDGHGVRFHSPRIGKRPGPRVLLTLRELAGLLPDPGGRGVDAPLPPSPPGSLILGRSHGGGIVGPPVEPNQGRHLAIVGETGMGKSSLLIAVARRAAALGGVVVFDPLGETGREIVRELGGAGGRVQWIAPGREGVGLNALAGAAPGGTVQSAVRAERSLTDLVHALRRVRSGRYADSGFWGPRLEEMLSRSLRAAASFPDGTLADAHTLLATGGVTRRPVPPAASESVGALAHRMRERPDDADGARRLLLEIVQNPTLEAMLCARRPAVLAEDLVRPGRIVVVNGDAAAVGESTARYLLAVYLAILWAALLARPAPAKTFVLLDEAQWFAHESLVEMLRVSRRLNVHLVISTQSILSLPEPVREAVRTNVADLVAFRGLADDAREFARWAPGATPERILALPRGEAAVFLGKGAAVHWVRTARCPPAPPSDPRAAVTAPPPDETAATAVGLDAPCAHAPPLDSLPAILGYLRSTVGSGDARTTVRVDLGDLRRRCGDNPQLVRAVGGWLGRRGAIVRTERGASGVGWWLDVDRLVPRAAEPASSDADSADAPQPS